MQNTTRECWANIQDEIFTRYTRFDNKIWCIISFGYGYGYDGYDILGFGT